MGISEWGKWSNGNYASKCVLTLQINNQNALSRMCPRE